MKGIMIERAPLYRNWSQALNRNIQFHFRQLPYSLSSWQTTSPLPDVRAVAADSRKRSALYRRAGAPIPALVELRQPNERDTAPNIQLNFRIAKGMHNEGTHVPMKECSAMTLRHPPVTRYLVIVPDPAPSVSLCMPFAMRKFNWIFGAVSRSLGCL